MKLIVKTLKQISYEVEAQEDTTVQGLKKLIEEKSNLDGNSMKVLFNGKVLEDSKLLSDYKLADGNILTMMTSKAKIVNAGTSNKPAEETKTTETVQKTATEPKEPKVAKPAIVEQNRPKKDYTAQIGNLKDMGFSEEQSKTAIEAANGDVNLAIDYLYNGVPVVGNSGNYGDEDEEYEGEEPMAIELDQEALSSLDLKDPNALSNIASIVKVLINEDPSSLEGLLSDIEESNSEIIDFIREKDQEFKTLIEQPVTEEDVARFNTLLPSQGQHEHENELSQLNSLLESQANNVGNIIDALNLTAAEKEAVNRLKELGFNEDEVIQTFVACNKDEMQTANVLLENKFKEGGDMNVDGI